MFCHVTLPQVSEFIWHWRCSTAPGFGSIPINLTNDQMFYGDTQGSDSPFVLQLPAALGHTHTYINIASPHTHTHTVRLPLSPLMLQVLRQQPHWWKMDDVKRREEWSRRRRSWTGSWETEQCDQPSVCLLLLEHTHTPIIKECLRPRSGISFLFQHKVLTVVHLLRYFSRLEFFTQWGYD